MQRRHVILLVLAAAVFIALIALTTIFTTSVARTRVLAERHSMGCLTNMIAIGVAARTWSGDHGGPFPTNFLSMSNMIFNTKILICPGDHSRHPAENFSSFTPGNCSYEIVTRGWKEGDARAVFVRCKIHGFLGYTDGSVYDNNGHKMTEW